MQQDKDVKLLEGLIAGLGGPDEGIETPGPSGLLMEHLVEARSNLMGSMRAEYGLNLDQAKGALACVPDKIKRAHIKETLLGLMNQIAIARR
jgi:hypothetical protein